MTRWQMLASPILALAANGAMYLVLRRGFGTGIGASIVGGLGFGLAVSVGLAWKSLVDADVGPVELCICQIGTYLALSFCFWAFLSLNLTSLRIRVIRQLLQAGGAIAVADLLASYSDEERLQRRLVRLTNSGQIELTEGHWRLRSSLILIIARCIDVIRAIMGARDGAAGDGNVRSRLRA